MRQRATDADARPRLESLELLEQGGRPTPPTIVGARQGFQDKASVRDFASREQQVS
jgi:hypothetical protein